MLSYFEVLFKALTLLVNIIIIHNYMYMLISYAPLPYEHPKLTPTLGHAPIWTTHAHELDSEGNIQTVTNQSNRKTVAASCMQHSAVYSA